MDAYDSKRLRQQAYIRKVMKTQRPHAGIAGVGRLVKDSSGLGAEFIRHSIQMIGVIGLVALAVGATTECHLYQYALNWVASFFY
jgi:hypothetical protein